VRYQSRGSGSHFVIQPPTFAEEHRAPEQENSKLEIGFEFGFTPRSTHASEQPRTQVIVVGPPGASTTNSKSGAVV
jgi:hypothetical protein